jgi:hypothetical protein
LDPSSFNGGGFSDAAKLAAKKDLSSFWIVEHLINLRLILIHKNDLTNSNSTTNHTVTPPLLQIVFNSAATKYANNANRIAYEQ